MNDSIAAKTNVWLGIFLIAGMGLASVVGAATVPVANFSGKDGVLTPAEFTRAQIAAGKNGTILFNQDLATHVDLPVFQKGLTIIGVDGPKGKRVLERANPTAEVTPPSHWDSLNTVPNWKITPGHDESAVLLIKANDVAIQNLSVRGRYWPLLKSNVASRDGEGARTARGVEYGIRVRSGGKSLILKEMKIEKVNVCVGFDHFLPHGFRLLNSKLTGGRGCVNSAESPIHRPASNALESRMIIDRNIFGTFKHGGRNFISARGVTFDYGNFAHHPNPFAGPGPVDFRGSEITRNTFGPFSTFTLGLTRCKNIVVGKMGAGNDIKVGKYRKSFINTIHFEAGSSHIKMIDNDLTIFRVGNQIVTRSMHIFGAIGHKTQRIPNNMLCWMNHYRGFPSGYLVEWDTKNWTFRDEKVRLWGGQLKGYVRNVRPGPGETGHRLEGSAATNDFWNQHNKWSGFKTGW